MRRVAVSSVKGGVGKSTVSAGLCFALRDKRYSVGYLELDISGTSGHRAFGVDPPRLGLRTDTSQMVPPMVNGIKIFPLASKFTEDACVGWKEGESIIELTPGEKIINPGRRGFIKEILTNGVDWGQIDYLVLDLPPSTGQDVMSFYEYIPDLFGVILVSQPSEIAVVGLLKTIDFLKGQERPIIGIVENMGACLCPKCGTTFYSLASQGVDLRKLAHEQDIPFLVSIPQSDSMVSLGPYFSDLADKVVNAHPKVFKQGMFSLRSRILRKVSKEAAKGVARVLPRERYDDKSG